MTNIAKPTANSSGGLPTATASMADIVDTKGGGEITAPPAQAGVSPKSNNPTASSFGGSTTAAPSISLPSTAKLQAGI